MTFRTRYWKEIQAAALVEDLDPILVEAVVVQESTGNADAFRFERDFWNRYLKLLPQYKDANPRRVSSSYGLMQIMYQTAVEAGYPAELPPEALFVPEVGLKWGTKQLRLLLDWANTGYPSVDPQKRLRASLASYNGGRGGNKPTETKLRNDYYATSVLKYRSALQAEHGVPA